MFVKESESVWAWTLEAAKRKVHSKEDALEGAMVDVKNVLSMANKGEARPDGRNCTSLTNRCRLKFRTRRICRIWVGATARKTQATARHTRRVDFLHLQGYCISPGGGGVALPRRGGQQQQHLPIQLKHSFISTHDITTALT